MCVLCVLSLLPPLFLSRFYLDSEYLVVILFQNLSCFYDSSLDSMLITSKSNLSNIFLFLYMLSFLIFSYHHVVVRFFTFTKVLVMFSLFTLSRILVYYCSICIKISNVLLNDQLSIFTHRIRVKVC